MQFYPEVTNCIHNLGQVTTFVLCNKYFASVDKLDNNIDNHYRYAWKNNIMQYRLITALQNLFKYWTCSSQHCTVCFYLSIISENQRITQVARFLKLE